MMMKIDIPFLYGKTIDALIAQYVMGWKPHTVGYFGVKEGDSAETKEQVELEAWAHKNGLQTIGDWWIDLDDQFFIKQDEWTPSTDIEQAYKALRRCIRGVPQNDMHIEYLGGCGWEVSTCYDRDTYPGGDGDKPKKHKWKSWHKSDTLPQAICVTALLWSKPEDVEFIFPEGVLLPDEDEDDVKP